MGVWMRENQLTLDGDMDIGGRVLFYGFFYPSVTMNVTARAGGGRANATQLADYISNVTTCASANDSVKLWQYPLCSGGIGGPVMIVKNSTANACDVYPYAATDQIDALGAGNPYSLASGATRTFVPDSSTHWVSM